VSKQTLTLARDLRIDSAEALKVTLLSLVDAGETVRLDGSRVQSADTATLQLLVTFVRSATQLGNRVLWSSASRPLLEAAELLDLTVALALEPSAKAPPDRTNSES